MAILRSPRNKQPLRDDQTPTVGQGPILNSPQNPPPAQSSQPSLYMPNAATGQPGIPAQSGETPTERGQIPGAGGGAPRAGSPFPHAAPSQPMTPDTSGTGSVSVPPTTFQPLPSYNPGSLVTSQAGGLAGSLGGLKGGGLGVPLQPSNPALDNPISLLISLLQNGLGGR